MRPIEFRAWDKIDGVMRDWGNLCSHRYGAKGETIFSDPQYILMQFTGLKDRNGKEIYEGDIITWKYRVLTSNAFVAQVVWSDWIELGDLDNDQRHVGFGIVFDDSDNPTDFPMPDKIIEVIGNIYEHPERLK